MLADLLPYLSNNRAGKSRTSELLSDQSRRSRPFYAQTPYRLLAKQGSYDHRYVDPSSKFSFIICQGLSRQRSSKWATQTTESTRLNRKMAPKNSFKVTKTKKTPSKESKVPTIVVEDVPSSYPYDLSFYILLPSLTSMS